MSGMIGTWKSGIRCLLSCPFYDPEELLLRRKEFRTVKFRQRLAFFHNASGIIDIELLNPALDLCIDRGQPSFIGFDPPHCPDDFPDGLHRNSDRLDADRLALFRGDFDLGRRLRHLFR